MRKRHFFLFAFAVAMLTACSSEDLGTTPNASKQAIRFDVPFVGQSTRSMGDLTNSNITRQSMKVWGDEYAESATTANSVFSSDNAKLSYSNDAWDVDKIAFWDENMKYDFLAVAPYDLSNVSYGSGDSNHALADRKLAITGIPAVKRIADGDDILVAATNEQTKAANATGGVQFNFNHILSRFSVYAYTAVPNTENTGYTVTLNSLSIYLPNDDAKASYNQATHGEVSSDADTWTWNGFTNASVTANEEDLTANYTKYDLKLEGDETSHVLQYAATLAEARQAAKAEGTKTSYLMQPEFFGAPTAKIADGTTVDLQLFMKITYTMTGKADSKSEQYTKFVPIQDLHSFKQGHQTNLFICIGEGDIIFGNFDVNGWQNTDTDAEHDFK